MKLRDVSPARHFDPQFVLVSRLVVILGDALTNLSRRSPNYWVEVGIVAGLPAEDFDSEGAFNNDWTLRLTGPLRFSFQHPQPHVFSITDQQNPSTDWKVDTAVAYMKQSDDYAIISRIKDPTTDRFVVVAAGVAYWGTISAGEFLTDPKYMEELAKTLPRGWEKKNLQVVIGTKVIAGNSGPPRVLAAHLW